MRRRGGGARERAPIHLPATTHHPARVTTDAEAGRRGGRSCSCSMLLLLLLPPRRRCCSHGQTRCPHRRSRASPLAPAASLPLDNGPPMPRASARPAGPRLKLPAPVPSINGVLPSEFEARTSRRIARATGSLAEPTSWAPGRHLPRRRRLPVPHGRLPDEPSRPQGALWPLAAAHGPARPLWAPENYRWRCCALVAARHSCHGSWKVGPSMPPHWGVL